MKLNIITSTIVFIAASLAGCGGGGSGSSTPPPSSQNISGQAAMGAPMSYAAISVKSLSDTTSGTVQASSDGSFTVPTGITSPALVTAISQDGHTTHYGYIGSATQSHVAVNPITTMGLTLAAQASPGILTAPLSTSQLSSGQALTLSELENVVTHISGIDTTQSFLTQKFTTNHTGLDQVLDDVEIALQPTGNLTVANKITGIRQSIASSSTSVTPLPFAAIDVTNHQTAINTCSTFLGGLNSTNITTTSYYDATFLENGRDTPTYITYMSQLAGAGVSYVLTTPVFMGVDRVGNYLFSMSINDASYPQAAVTGVPMTTKLNGSNCVLVGNQFPWEITVQPIISQEKRVDSLAGTGTGNEVLTPIRGFEVYFGGYVDGVNTYNSARADVCDSLGNCNLLTTFSLSSGALRPDVGAGVYPNLRIIPNPTAFDILSDNLNPIRITFYSSLTAPTNPTTTTAATLSGKIGQTYWTRADAAAFTDTEFASISTNMPSITNAATILQGTVSSPTLNLNSGIASTVISGVDYRSYDFGSNSIEGFALILKSGPSISSTIPLFIDVALPQYKHLTINGHPNGRNGMISVKYLWAPTCAGCN